MSLLPQRRTDFYSYCDCFPWLPDAVSDVLWFLIDSYGFRIKEHTVSTELRCNRSTSEWCVRMWRDNGITCTVRWFDLFEMMRPYKGHCYSVHALGKAVPEAVRKTAEFLVGKHRSFLLTERRLADSPQYLHLEKRIQTRDDTGGIAPMCLVVRIELGW